MTNSTYQPGTDGIDTYVPISGVTNHGADPYVLVNAGNHGLIKFDISDIPSTAECVSAVLSLYSWAGTGTGVPCISNIPIWNYFLDTATSI